MQLSMGYDHIDGKKLIFLLCTLFLGITLQAQNQDFSRVKSKYDFKTEATEKLMLLMSESTKSDEALKFADTKIAEARKANQYEELVLLLERKAELFRRLQQFDEAEKTATQAIEIAKNQLGKNHFLLSKSYLTRGIIQHRRTDFYRASSNFDTAQVTYENADRYDSSMYNRIIDYKYYAYTYSEKNVDTLKKYLDIRLSTVSNNTESTAHDIIALMNDYPRIYRELGDFDQALAYSLLQVSYANENIKDIISTDHTLAYFNLIYTLYFMKEYALAIAICDDILSFYKGKNTFKDPVNLNDLNSIRSSILVSLKEYNKAIDQYLSLISIFKDANKPNEVQFLIQNQINVASCYMAIGQEEVARAYLDEALNTIKNVNPLPDKQAAALFEIRGRYYELQNDFINSFSSYDSTVKNNIPEYFLDNPLNFPKTKAQKVSFEVLLALKKKTISFTRLYQNEFNDSLALLNSANEYVLNTHNILIERRKELMRTEGKLFLSNNFKSLYESGILSSYLLIDSGQLNKGISSASEFFRMSKSILFLEQAGDFEEINRNNIPQYMKERYYKLSMEMKAINSEFHYNFNQSSLLTDSIKVLNLQVLESTKKLSEIRDSIDLYIQNNNAENKVPLKNNNESSLQKNHLSIEFFVGDTVIFVLGKTRDTEFLESVPLDSTLKANIDYVIKQVSVRPDFSNYKSLLTNFNESSGDIYNKLLAPIINQITEEIKYITFIPDDFLSRIPFEILSTNKSFISSSFKDIPYLVKNYSINYRLTSNDDQNEHLKTTSKNILGFAYSEKKNEKTNGSNRLNLPGTEQEIKQLQSVFDGDYYFGADATKALFLAEAKNFDILHLAIHGETDENNKYDARLIFNGKDSLLNTEDLYLANIKARLVVLSACESGTGEVIKGEGTFSIARGFALVGVPSIIMSLWSVNDKVTSQLMSNFYESISKGLASTEALSQSKLTYLEKSDNYTSHPYYWSSFVSLGDPIQLYTKPLNLLILVFCPLLGCILAIVWFYYHQKRRRTK